MPPVSDYETKLRHSRELDEAARTDQAPTASEGTFLAPPAGEAPRFAGEVESAQCHRLEAEVRSRIAAEDAA